VAALPSDAAIRSYHPSDLPSLYRICHATGWNGGDASAHVEDPDLLGHCYVGPYATLDPETCFVAQTSARVVGYVVATPDTTAFHRRAEATWFPMLRSRYALPSYDDNSPTALFTRTLHTGHPPPSRVDPVLYPASLHIDILPEAQGQGVGRRLMNRLFNHLKTDQVKGAHLYAGLANTRAIAFYKHLGFDVLDETDRSIGFGYRLE
jgi:ribosomal protein S18 acetylase RimI-like enzyme